MNNVIKISKDVILFHNDCLEVLKDIEDNTIDSLVTDPPYGLSDHTPKDVMNCLSAWMEGKEYTINKKGFMSMQWDNFVPSPMLWKEVLRVLKPGAHALVFTGARTYDLMGISLRLAGFEIRDTIMYTYGSGFPKGLNIGKGIENKENLDEDIKRELLEQYNGWRTHLKPAYEPIILCRKPMEGTIVDNTIEYGTGGINIDDSRVEIDYSVDDMKREVKRNVREADSDWTYHSGFRNETNNYTGVSEEGRFPTNLIHDGSEEVLKCFPESKGQQGDVTGKEPSHTGDENTVCYGEFKRIYSKKRNETAKSSSRFFKCCPDDDIEDFEVKSIIYCPKASNKDRNEGCEELKTKKMGFSNGAQIHGEGYDKGQGIGLNKVIERKNTHPTVKPNSLMRYLCKLITPKDGIILDPFMGSGSTGKAAIQEGFKFLGIEKEEEYIIISEKRINHALKDEK